MRLTALFILIALVQQPGGPPYSPQSAISTLRIEPGFRIDLMTSEPDIVSPVAMDIDEDGRWFVVEMPGIPLIPVPAAESSCWKTLTATAGPTNPRCLLTSSFCQTA